MRKLIAKYRFQIAFTLSLVLHFSAFLLCPHFGGEQGDTTSYQTVEVNFTDAGDFSATTEEETESETPYFEEAVYKEPTEKQILPKEVSMEEAMATPTAQHKKTKNKPQQHQKAGKQKAGNSSTSGQSDGVEIFSLQQATLLKKLPLPPYPKFARKRGLEGSVTVRVLINANGLIKDIKIVHYEGSDIFVKAVFSTVRQKWQGVFAPHKKSGIYIDGWIEVTIPFKLR